MDNDTKYGENLQVRMTRMAARVMTGDDVTVPDAEFVYEGADEIPGRPQRIVDALLAANDAYDEMGDYSETGDTRLIMRGAGQLGVDWDDDTVHAIAEALEAIEQATAAVKVWVDLVEQNRKYPLYTNQVYAGTHYARG